MVAAKGGEKPNRYVHIIYIIISPGINYTDDGKNKIKLKGVNCSL